MNPIDFSSGRAYWTHRDGDKYLVTGVDREGKRFSQTWSSWCWAAGINLWCGSKWLLRDDKQYLICRVSN